MKLLSAVVLTLVLAQGVSRQANSLTDALVVKLSFIHDAVRLDGLIETEITFVNVGDESLYVERSDSIGPQDIEILVSDATCEYKGPSVRATILASHQHFRLTPLRPWERYTQGLIPINDLAATGATDLLLPKEGRYAVRAVFHSEGETAVDGRSPVWRGTATSDPITLFVLPPSQGKVGKMRTLLEEGLTAGAVDPESIAYFRHVRDPLAADLLVRIIQAGSRDPWLPEAVAHQRRPPDANALETLSKNLSRTDQRSAEAVSALAKRLRAPRPCDLLNY